MLNGEVNRHHCCYLSDTNTHLFTENRTQVAQILNVRAGILGNHPFDPSLFKVLLKGTSIYLELLEDTVLGV